MSYGNGHDTAGAPPPRPSGRERWPRYLATSLERVHLRLFHRWRDRRTVRGSSSLVGLPNGLQIFHELVCVGLGFPFARHVPDGLLSRSATFRCGVAFQAGTSPKKDCMSLLFARKTNTSEDRLLANAWSKDYIRWREKVTSRQLVRRESAHDANKAVAKAKNGQNREPY